MHLNSKSFLSTVFVLISGTVVGQGIMLLSSPLLTRLYSPEDFGKFSLITAFWGISTIFATLSYDSAIVAAKDDREAIKLTILAMSLPLVTSLFALLILYILISVKAIGFGVLSLWILPVIWPGLVATPMFNSLRNWLVRTNSFQHLSKVSIIQNVIRALSQIGLSFIAPGWSGLLVGELISRGGGVMSMIKHSQNDFHQELFPIKLNDLIATMQRYNRFPLFVLPSSLIDTLALTLPLPLIAEFYGVTAAGYFALVQRVMAVPISLIGTSVADVFYNRVSIYARQNPAMIERFFLQTAISLGVLGLLPAVTLIFYGPYLFGVAFGSSWSVAGSMAAAMSIWTLAQFVVSPLTRIVYVVGNQRLKLIYDTLSLVIVLGVLYGGYFWRFSVLKTILVLSFMNAVAYIIYFFLLLMAIRHAKTVVDY